MKLVVMIEGHEKTVEIEEKDGRYLLEIDGARRLVDCREAGHGNRLSLIIDDESHVVESAPVKFEDGAYFASISGRRYDVVVLDERLRATRQGVENAAETGEHTITSPMPGLIVEVRVAVGDRIAVGDTVAIMEAMKMQNELTSEVDGVVTGVNVKAGDSVESLAALVTIERNE